MAEFKITPVICSVITPAQAFKRPGFIDLQRYSGKWYVVACIPSAFDEDWDQTTETYTVRADGDIDILTTYRKRGSSSIKEVRAKGFPQDYTAHVSWKVQLFWPFRVDYLIEEIADDYSWVVVGHPKRKFLYIMSRTRSLEPVILSAVTERSRRSGYNISQLRHVRQ